MRRALFHGSTWEHIPKASLDVTEAERGYYVADEHGGLRVRAAIDVPAHLGETPSQFIASIGEAFSPEQARAELHRCAGTQFDPRIVEVVLRAIDEGNALEEAGGIAPDAQAGCGILPGMIGVRT